MSNKPDSPFSIIQEPNSSTHKHPHEAFAEHEALAATLRRHVRGEVRFDPQSRALYSTDASNFRQIPIGIVIPKNIEDVVATLSACREFRAAVLSRGAGTSLAGQSCNSAVVIDFSKYLRRILSLDPQTGRASVEPGIVLDDLRVEAEKHELTFAPDPATHSRCTLGGMIGNNACGVHALMGGKTVDNIEELEILLYDGTRMRVGATTEEELLAIISGGGRRGEIYEGLRGLRDAYGSLIRERFPRIPRRVSGYNLDELLPENGFNVARALVGSEGTCVTVLEAVCKLKASPQHRRLVVIAFRDAFVAADHVPAILKYNPIGLEGFDGLLVSYMRKKNLVTEELKLLPPGEGFLLCEFGADTPTAVDKITAGFVEAAGYLRDLTGLRTYTTEEAPHIWKVRESGLGASVFVPGEPNAWEGWEDAAVPPEHLGAYLRDIFALIEQYGYKSPMYGHFGQGCVHLRITFDFRTPSGVAKYRRFLDQAADVVMKHGGSFSGEHGDGQARGWLLPKMFGPELMQAFVDFKTLWDPLNRMNPGKLIDPFAVYDATENLRIGPDTKLRPVNTWFKYPGESGSFAEATSRCVGVGACRKHDSGTMCPSYIATREEKHSTRGRAHLLWEMLNGEVIKGGWRDLAVKDALDLCLACKACKTECPVNVDMASWKAEFLAHYYRGRMHQLNHYAFGFMNRWARVASITPSLVNFIMRVPGVDLSVKKVLGIAPQRALPSLARYNFTRTHIPITQNHGCERVLLWPDTWNNYFHPQALTASVSVLESAGYDVVVPKHHVCCGRPLYDFGFLDQARSYLSRILKAFRPEIDAGLPVVMLEPSCASVFRDELLNFFPNDARARRLSEQTVMLSDVLLRNVTWKTPQLRGRRIFVHGHCHQHSLSGMQSDVQLLKRTGADVRLLDAGCCGMAGPFGFEKNHFAISQALAERVLLPAVRAAAEEDLIVVNGFSCREQIKQNSSRSSFHLAEVLALEHSALQESPVLRAAHSVQHRYDNDKE